MQKKTPTLHLKCGGGRYARPANVRVYRAWTCPDGLSSARPAARSIVGAEVVEVTETIATQATVAPGGNSRFVIVFLLQGKGNLGGLMKKFHQLQDSSNVAWY